MEYDICIVGAGMIGSAVAKYCSIYAKDATILLIGPDEPAKKDYGSTEIFGSYYDQGRITGHLDFDPLWCYLSKESIKKYRDIEKRSGLEFFNETGYLNLFNADDESFKLFQNVLNSQSIDFTIIDDWHELKRRYAYLNIKPGTVGLLETAKAGVINPRTMVTAQQKLALENGVCLLRDIVRKIQRDPDTKGYRICTIKNGTLTATKVIVCTGSFLWHNELLPKDRTDIEVKSKLVTAALIPMVENYPSVLSTMPSLSLMSKVKGVTEGNPLGLPFSLMAPIKYPNGQWYLKIVIRGDLTPQNYNSPEAVTDWYRRGETNVSGLKRMIAATVTHFIPDLHIADEEQIVVYTCALMETPNYMPYVDTISENYTLVTGCNGNAARSSDEFGRLAAKLALFAEWDCPFSLDNFKCLYKR